MTSVMMHTTQPNQGIWDCSRCTFNNNYPGEDSCVICQAPKPVAEPEIHECHICTFHNRNGDTDCEMCGTSLIYEATPPIAEAAVAVPVMWACSKCTYDNEGHHDNCEMCGEEKPLIYTSREGEGGGGGSAVAEFLALERPEPAAAAVNVEYPPEEEEIPCSSPEQELALCRKMLQEKIDELEGLERELTVIRHRAGPGVADFELSPEQGQARRELIRMESLRNYIQKDLIQIQTQCTELRIRVLELG